jgi:hypothetical protein
MRLRSSVGRMSKLALLPGPPALMRWVYPITVCPPQKLATSASLL